MAHDVFISYSSKDKKVADAACSALEHNQIRCWIAPRDITPGKEWGEEIVSAISESKIMVLIFSAASNQSQQVLREVERAVNKNVIVVPFRIEDIVPTKSMEYFLYSTHWLDALSSEIEDHIDCLVETVGKLAGTETVVKDKKAETKNLSKKKQRLIVTVAVAVTALSIIFGSIGVWMAISASKKVNEPVSGFNDKQSQPSVNVIKDSPEITEEKASTQAAIGKTPSAQVVTGGSTSVINTNVAENSTASGNQVNTQEPVISSIDEAIQVKVGDYIKFGTYIGQPIVWRVININKNGNPLLLTDKIISFKPFDSAEGNTAEDAKRKTYGSNNWINSNLREWLNSSGKTVKYSTAAPVKNGVYCGDNSFDTEAGFLNGFSDAEKKRILVNSNKVILPELEKDLKKGGNSVFSFASKAKVNSAIQNYDSAFYSFSQDRVFLLSLMEVKDYIWDRGWEIRALPTQQAEARDETAEYKELKKETDNYWMWWTRTPSSTSTYAVCYVSYDGSIDVNHAFISNTGVRPALYLTSSKFNLEGDGSEANPYSIK